MAKAKFYTDTEKFEIVRDFMKSGVSYYKYAQAKGLRDATLKKWHLALKEEIKKMPREYSASHSKGVPEETRIKIVKDLIVNNRTQKQIAKKYKISVNMCTYYKAQWREGKLLIPGLPPTDDAMGPNYKKSTKPLAFDASAQIEIERLKVLIQYLKDILEENNIVWNLNEYSGPAKDKYLMNLIEANGIDLGMESS